MTKRVLLLLFVLERMASAGTVTGALTADSSKTAATSFPEDISKLTLSYSTKDFTGTVHTSWVVVKSDALAANDVICQSTLALKPGTTPTAGCQPRAFEPGEYRIDFTADDKSSLGSLAYTITAVGTPAVKMDASSKPAGKDLAATANGGHVRLVSSEQEPASALIDGVADAAHEDEWRADSPHAEIVLSFFQERSASISAVAIDSTATGTQANGDPKLVEVWTSTSADIDAPFTKVATARLARAAGDQLITFAPVAAQLVKVRVVSTYGDSAGMSELEVFEAPGPSITADAVLPVELDGTPIELPGPPKLAEQLAKATTIPIDAVSDFKPTGEAWFRFDVTSPQPVIVHVGTLNVMGGKVKLYDAAGHELRAVDHPKDTLAAWHARLPAGTYYVDVSGSKGFPAPDASATAAAAASPAMLIMTEPVPAVRTPQSAAQLGLDFLEVQAPSWQDANHCGGCHIQAQTLMGMSVAKKNHYRVFDRVAVDLGELLVGETKQQSVTAEQYRELGIRFYADGYAPDRASFDQQLAATVLAKPPKNFVFLGERRKPIEDGTITATSIAVQTYAALARDSQDPAAATLFKAAIDGGLTYLHGAKLTDVQDVAMTVLADVAGGAPRADVDAQVTALLAMQNGDGGFPEMPTKKSSAYSTGQALYALRVAGYRVGDPAFKAGVKWLLDHQLWDGSWPVKETEAKSEIASTMWPVIALAGSIDNVAPPPPPAPKPPRWRISASLVTVPPQTDNVSLAVSAGGDVAVARLFGKLAQAGARVRLVDLRPGSQLFQGDLFGGVRKTWRPVEVEVDAHVGYVGGTLGAADHVSTVTVGASLDVTHWWRRWGVQLAGEEDLVSGNLLGTGELGIVHTF